MTIQPRFNHHNFFPFYDLLKAENSYCTNWKIITKDYINQWNFYSIEETCEIEVIQTNFKRVPIYCLGNTYFVHILTILRQGYKEKLIL